MNKYEKRRKKLQDTLRRVEFNAIPGRKPRIRCIQWTRNLCSGEFVVRKHDKRCPIWKGQQCDCRIKQRTFVGAHELPVFVQCSGCGHAPDTLTQAVILGRMTAGKTTRAAKART